MRPDRLLAPLLCLALAGLPGPVWAATGTAWSLEELTERALRHVPLVAATEAQVAAVEAKLFQARRAWIPRGQVKSFFTVMPAARGDGVSGETDKSEWGPFTRTELTLALPIYTFGKFASLRELAEAGVDVARARKRLASLRVVRMVREAWGTLLLSRRAEEVITEGKKHVERARARLDKLEEEDSDDYDPTDSLRLRLVESDVAEREIDARAGERLAMDALRILTGLDATDPVRLKIDDLPAPASAVPSEEDSLAVARTRRPEMAALRGAVALRRANVRLISRSRR